MRRISLETKNNDPELYGYEHPWDIPGNEGCGKYNPVNKGKPKCEIPLFRESFFRYKDADGDIRYFVMPKEKADTFRNYFRNEVRRADTESRCLVPSERYGLKKCREDCFYCPYNKAARDGKAISIDMIQEEYGFEPSDGSYEECEDRLEDKSVLAEIAILATSLDEIDKFLIDNANETDVEIAKHTNMTKQAIGYRRKRLIKYLQKKLEK